MRGIPNGPQKELVCTTRYLSSRDAESMATLKSGSCQNLLILSTRRTLESGAQRGRGFGAKDAGGGSTDGGDNDDEEQAEVSGAGGEATTYPADAGAWTLLLSLGTGKASRNNRTSPCSRPSSRSPSPISLSSLQWVAATLTLVDGGPRRAWLTLPSCCSELVSEEQATCGGALLSGKGQTYRELGRGMRVKMLNVDLSSTTTAR